MISLQQVAQTTADVFSNQFAWTAGENGFHRGSLWAVGLQADATRWRPRGARYDGAWTDVDEDEKLNGLVKLGGGDDAAHRPP